MPVKLSVNKQRQQQNVVVHIHESKRKRKAKKRRPRPPKEQEQAPVISSPTILGNYHSYNYTPPATLTDIHNSLRALIPVAAPNQTQIPEPVANPHETATQIPAPPAPAPAPIPVAPPTPTPARLPPKKRPPVRIPSPQPPPPSPIPYPIPQDAIDPFPELRTGAPDIGVIQPPIIPEPSQQYKRDPIITIPPKNTNDLAETPYKSIFKEFQDPPETGNLGFNDPTDAGIDAPTAQPKPRKIPEPIPTDLSFKSNANKWKYIQMDELQREKFDKQRAIMGLKPPTAKQIAEWEQKDKQGILLTLKDRIDLKLDKDFYNSRASPNKNKTKTKKNRDISIIA
jgi:hypothetical protein